MSGIIAVWQRNFLYFQYTVWVTLMWVLLEPALMLFAIGYGLGPMVGDIEGVPYVEFFFPSLMCFSGLMVSFFESAYGSYTKLAKQKTYDSMLLAPLLPYEIGIGEILWAASKGFLSCVGVALVGWVQGLLITVWVFPSFILMAMLCWMAAAFGMWLASRARNYDSFIYAQTGILTPMVLFSGTYFPLHRLPLALEYLAWLSPLTHAVYAVRALFNAQPNWTLLGSFGLLLIFCLFLTPLAIRRLESRLIV